MRFSHRRGFCAKCLAENLFCLLFGFFAYMGIEILFRGYTYALMGVFGGVIFTLIGHINDRRNIGLFWQGMIGGAAITATELASGAVMLQCGMRMWDYSGQWGNYNGLVCPLFSLFWVFLSIEAAVVDDTLKCLLFGEAARKYTLFGLGEEHLDAC